MKTIKSLPVVAALMLIAGCATTFTPWSLEKVTPGMDKADVVQVLGEPNAITTEGTTEILHYTYEPGIDAMTLEASNMVDNDSRRRIEQKMDTDAQHFEVRLQAGKVVSQEQVN